MAHQLVPSHVHPLALMRVSVPAYTHTPAHQLAPNHVHPPALARARVPAYTRTLSAPKRTHTEAPTGTLNINITFTRSTRERRLLGGCTVSVELTCLATL